MRLSIIADFLWGNKAKFSYLFLAALLLIFTFLGNRQIWTQEHRWADIVYGMFYRNDFLHPYLGNLNYYDKPLLSYWLIALFSKLNHGLTTFTLRLPSALAGLLSICSIYRIGSKLKDKHLGLLSGWFLLTTYYFVFWSRTSSADMLNLAGSLFAISWYFDNRYHANFFSYVIFFVILAITSLCKGLIGAIVPLIAILIDMILQKSWRNHLNLSLFLAFIPAFMLYLTPFLASSYIGVDSFNQNGLYLVYRENFLRYFQPFDHHGSIYIYFIYLPIYTLPLTLFFFSALIALKSNWKNLSLYTKWIALVLFILFIFLSLSGSRRSYYVLPIVPFAVLLTADWVLSEKRELAKRRIWSAGCVLFSFIFLYLILDIMPAWYESLFGVNRFATSLKQEVTLRKPWNEWHIVILDAESKLNFYLQLPPDTKKYYVKPSSIPELTQDQLLSSWPVLTNIPKDTIFITRACYASVLRKILRRHQLFQLSYPPISFLVKKNHDDVPVAFIPSD